MSQNLTLISHYLCPYVQRAVIALTEKNIEFERKFIDLANKPDWFLKISPLGRVPVLLVGDTPVFESSVILEYLEETLPHKLHPEDPLTKADHRSWMEFGSTILADIAGLYSAPNKEAFDLKVEQLQGKFEILERKITGTPFFAGEHFSLIDTVYGPIFRYFNTFEKIGDFKFFDNKPKVQAWKTALLKRPSVITAVADDYDERLWIFLQNRNSYLTSLMS